MADEEQNQNEDQQPSSEKKGGLPMKTILAVAVMLVVEAGVIVGILTMFGSPSNVHAVDLTGEIDENERLVEITVLHEKFTNNSTGRIWVWDVELLVQTKAKYAERVEEFLVSNNATVRTKVGEIIAAANHRFFHEPGRPTITRQVREQLRTLIGKDEATGDEIIEEVLIPSCTGFPTDY